MNYIPSSFENGIWKQFYIENIRALQYIPLKVLSNVKLSKILYFFKNFIFKANTPMITERSELLSELSNGQFGFNRFAKTNPKQNKSFRPQGPLKHPPWKGNSFNPNHLHRYNYLDSEDAIEKRSEKIIKSLDTSVRNQAATKAAAAASLKINKSEHYSNQKIIENLIEKGQTLLNEINLKDQYPFKNIEPQQEKSVILTFFSVFFILCVLDFLTLFSKHQIYLQLINIRQVC